LLIDLVEMVFSGVQVRIGPHPAPTNIADIDRGAFLMVLEHGVALHADCEINLSPQQPTDCIDDMLKEAFHSAQDPPPLRLADILQEIEGALTYYICFPHPAMATLIACWLAGTYCFREFSYCGYLAIRSKGPGSGKTRLLELLSAFSKGNPPIYTSPTAAALFRGKQEVILIDEVERLRGQDRQTYGLVLAILNAGFASTGVVPRTERVNDHGKFDVVHHPVYGPKAFAGLETLEPTLESRCFHIEMTQASHRPPRFSMRWYGETAKRIRDELSAWASAHQQEIQRALSVLPRELRFIRRYDDRYQDISEPLILLAALADAGYGGVQKILPALLEALRIAASQRNPPSGERLAVALDELLTPVLHDREEAFIPSKDLLGKVQAGGLTWIDSMADLAKALAQFGLHPRSNGVLHGYNLTREWIGTLTNRQG